MLPWWARQQSPRIGAERYRASETSDRTPCGRRLISGAESTLECPHKPAGEGPELAASDRSPTIM